MTDVSQIIADIEAQIAQFPEEQFPLTKVRRACLRALLEEVRRLQARQAADVSEGAAVVRAWRTRAEAAEAAEAARKRMSRTIYDRRSAVDEQVRNAAPTLYHALKDLLSAVEERQGMRESIESTTIAEAHRALMLASSGGNSE